MLHIFSLFILPFLLSTVEAVVAQSTLESSFNILDQYIMFWEGIDWGMCSLRITYKGIFSEIYKRFDQKTHHVFC